MHTYTRWPALCSLIGGLLILAAAASPAMGQGARRGGTQPGEQTSALAGHGASAAAVAYASPSALAPFKAGGRFFSLDDAGALQVRSGATATPRTLLAAGTFGVVAPSPGGKYIAYGVPDPHDSNGAYEVHVRDVATGEELPGVLHHARISPAPWGHNQKGFLYIRQDPADGRERIYYHGIGRAESNDVIVFSQFDHPEWRYAARVSDDGQYAVFTISYPADSHTRIYFIDLDDPGEPNFEAPVVKLAQSFDARYEFIDNAGNFFILQSDRAAPLGRIILANTGMIRASRWPAIVQEAGDTLLYARTAGDQYVVAVYRSASGESVARVYGAEDPDVIRKEMEQRRDSLKKARKDDEQAGRASRPAAARDLMGSMPVIRLLHDTDIPIPAGATLIAMNSVADDSQLFYTVKLSDGTMRSFMYNVKESSNQPFPVPAASPASPPTVN